LRNKLYRRIKNTAINSKIILISQVNRSNKVISEKLLYLLKIKDKKIILRRRVIITVSNRRYDWNSWRVRNSLIKLNMII